MTTTVLTSFESRYKVGEQHVHFNLRSSTPTVSGVNDMDAMGSFRVIRNNQIIKREDDILDFAWLGQDGDKVYARFTDVSGNAGAWEYYTYSVSSSYDYNYYFDSSVTGTGTGTSGDPWKSVSSVTAVNAAMTDGGTYACWFKEGQTFHLSSAGSTLINNYNTATKYGMMRFVRWGNTSGVSNPIIHWDASNTNSPSYPAGSDPFFIDAGRRESFQFSAVDFLCPSTAAFFRSNRSTTLSGEPLNFLMADCNVSAGSYFLYIVNGRITTPSGFATLEDNSFIALKNVFFDGWKRYINGVQLFEIGSNFKYIYLKDFEYKCYKPSRQYPGGFKFLGIRDSYFESVSAYYEGASGFNIIYEVFDMLATYSLQEKPTDLERCSNLTYNKCLYHGVLPTYYPAYTFNTGRLAVFRNIRYVDCKFSSYNNSIVNYNGTTNNGVDAENIQLKRSLLFGDGIGLYNQSQAGQATYPTASGIFRSVSFYDCIFDYPASRPVIRSTTGWTQSFASGCLRFRNNVCHASTGSKLQIIFAPQMNPSAIVEKVELEENNLWSASGASTSSTAFHYYGSGSPDNFSLARGRDHAASALGVTLNAAVYYSSVTGVFNNNVPGFVNRVWVSAAPLDNVSYFIQQDCHTSSTSSAMYQRGYLPAVPSKDGDGYKRGPTYTDIGPYQFDVTLTLLDDPSLGSNDVLYLLPISVTILS